MRELLSHFNLMATAPGGVAKLRELILTLAVQGKLVPQDPADEPASELLKRIRTEKDRLIAAGKIKRDKPLAPVGEEEQPFELPVGWTWVRLIDLMPEFQNGASSRGDVGGTPITVLRLADIKDKRISLVETRQVPIAPSDIAKYQLTEGDILITRVNGSADIVGQFNLCDRQVEAIYCDHFIRMRIDRHWVEPSFCALLGESALVRSAIKSLFITTAGQKTVNQGHIGSLQFPLPPLPEQARIVACVEELMRVCDALEAKGQQQAAHHHQLVQTLLGTLTGADRDPDTATPTQDAWPRVAAHFDTLLDRPSAVDALEQTILQLAVRGQLVPQDPTDEPASELLKRIRTEKDRLIAEGKIKRDKPLAPIGADEQPFGLPRGWEWVRLGDIWQSSFYGPRFGNEEYVSKGGIPTIRTTDMSNGQIVLKNPPFVNVPLDKYDAYLVQKGDLLVTRSGSIGVMALFDLDIDAVPSAYLIRLRFSELMLPKYCFEYFLSELGQRQLGLSTTAVGVPNVSASKMADFAFPLPPLPEQARIVARVAHLRRLCADLRQRLSQSQTTQAALADALVAALP